MKFYSHNLNLTILLFFAGLTSTLFSQTVSTFAGSGAPGWQDGQSATAEFFEPTDITQDSQGNLYVADYMNHRIRKVTPSGIVSTFAGSSQGFSNGTGINAQFSNPYGLCIGPNGNLYVSDYTNHVIRKVTPSGMVSTIAGDGISGYQDGQGTNARFHLPAGICSDVNGNLFVTDRVNCVIRKITPSGVVTTIAGSVQGYQDGPANSAQFDNPQGICVDSVGNLFVSDFSNHCIRKIDTNGMVTTLAGTTSAGFQDGLGANARFNYPTTIDISQNGILYLASPWNNAIRKISPAGDVVTYTGTGAAGHIDGVLGVATFNFPGGICVTENDEVFIADRYNQVIRKISNCEPISALVTLETCGPYQLNEETYNSSGIYTQSFIATSGCDSVLTIDLTINDLDISITDNSPSLFANETNVSYQWIDCSTNLPITGEVNQQFMASSNGNYAVILSSDFCVDTSACVIIDNVSLSGLDSQLNVKIYPNPFSNHLTITSEVANNRVFIFSGDGKLLLEDKFNSELTLDTKKWEFGNYLVRVINEDRVFHTSLLKINE